MVNNDAGMDIPAYAKGLRATEIGKKRERVLDWRRGRWERHDTGHQSGPSDAGNRNIQGADDVGTFGEPPLPHGSGW